MMVKPSSLHCFTVAISPNPRILNDNPYIKEYEQTSIYPIIGCGIYFACHSKPAASGKCCGPSSGYKSTS